MRWLVDLQPCRPEFGLALDEVLLESLRHGGPETVRVWINDRAIVVGRSQAVHDEVDEASARQHGFPVLRRISGGGTVVHYRDNLNISAVVRERPGWRGVEDVFSAFGEALASGMTRWSGSFRAHENGIYASELKVGGAAQARRGRAILYHSTLMVQPCRVPFDVLLRALRPGYDAAAPASKPRPVISVSEVVRRPVDAGEVTAAAREGLERRLQLELCAGAWTDAERAAADALTERKYGRREWNHRR